MSVVRDWHWTDSPAPDGIAKHRRRVIGNWINYKDTVGVWRESKAELRSAKQGESFLGLKVAEVQDTSPLCTYIGDPADLGGRPWTGLRLSDKEDTGIISFPPEAKATTKSVDLAAREVSKAEVMLSTDLYEYAGTDRAERWFALLPGAKPIVKLGFILPAGWTIRVEGPGKPGSIFVISDEKGEAVYRSRPARAVDSTEKEPKDVPCWFEVPVKKTLDKRSYWEIAKVCDPSVKGLVRPILMDDTTTISGTAAINENSLLLIAPLYNGGAYASQGAVQSGTAAGASNERRAMLSVSTASIPVGTISAFRVTISRGSAAQSAKAGKLQFFRVLPANAWVEGTGTFAGTAATGEPCWNYAAYHASTPTAWAGSAGCGTSGTDYAADASPPSLTYAAYTSGGTVLHTITLPVAWADGWKQGTFANRGIIMKNDYVSYTPDTDLFSGYSTENATVGNRPYFEIDYIRESDLSHMLLDPRGNRRDITRHDPREIRYV